ncbi:ileal sodium/bile acid cotransporter-like [Lytechinus pictus]|uniref:ileal sodium/bile acid cotransporter-like n=1 Tax=Lytechinus pictus TaxID=7653 RepID=UPI0030BA16AF
MATSTRTTIPIVGSSMSSSSPVNLVISTQYASSPSVDESVTTPFTTIFGSTTDNNNVTMSTSDMMTTLNHTGIDINPVHEGLRKFNSILLPVLMVIIMTSIGCLVTIDGLKQAIRRPVGVAIGFAGQFLVLPLLAFCLAVVLKMEAANALGMLMVATSPGGVSSSLFVYWMNGNICLSLCMSTVATLASVGMMPFNLFIYTRYWEAAQITIPYVQIALALALILIPVFIGLFIRYKKEAWTPYIIKTGSILGLVAIILNLIINTIINTAIFQTSWSVWFSAIALPFFSFGLAYLLAWILRQDHKNCRTIAVETSSQNVALTLAIIGVTFADQQLDALVVYPSLYSIFLIFDGLIMIPVYWIGAKYVLPRLRRSSKEQKETETPDPEGGLTLIIPKYKREQSRDSNVTVMTPISI